MGTVLQLGLNGNQKESTQRGAPISTPTHMDPTSHGIRGSMLIRDGVCVPQWFHPYHPLESQMASASVAHIPVLQRPWPSFFYQAELGYGWTPKGFSIW